MLAAKWLHPWHPKRIYGCEVCQALVNILHLGLLAGGIGFLAMIMKWSCGQGTPGIEQLF